MNKLNLLFHINVFVVLLDRMHMMWTLPRTEWRSKTRANKGERGIWKRRFWEHTIRDENDY